MKRSYYLLTMALILVISHGAKAGSHGGGIKTGLLISNPIVKQEEYSFESINTISFGPFYRYSVSNSTALQLELLYSRKGAASSIEIEYLDLTSILQYRLRKIDHQYIDLYVGPIFSIKLDSSDEEIIYSSTNYYGTISDIRRNDFGFVVGTKLGFGKSKNEYSIDLRYTSGFLYINDNSTEANLKNRTFSIMIEMYFGKG